MRFTSESFGRPHILVSFADIQSLQGTLVRVDFISLHEDHWLHSVLPKIIGNNQIDSCDRFVAITIQSTNVKRCMGSIPVLIDIISSKVTSSKLQNWWEKWEKRPYLHPKYVFLMRYFVFAVKNIFLLGSIIWYGSCKYIFHVTHIDFVLGCNEIYLSLEVLGDHRCWSPSQVYNLYRGLLCE